MAFSVELPNLQPAVFLPNKALPRAISMVMVDLICLLPVDPNSGTYQTTRAILALVDKPIQRSLSFLKAPLFDNQYATSTLVADFNNDGRDDLVIGNGGLTRVALEDLSWLFRQFENDGHEASNDNSEDKAFFDTAKLEQFSIYSRQRNCCYASIGTSGFAEVSSASGLNSQDDSRALAATDWDHDGDVDVLMVNRNGPQLRFFMNFLNRGNSVSFRLRGEDIQS